MNRRILFVFDRVIHYHQDLFRELERRLKTHKIDLFLLSGEQESGGAGRVSVAEKTIQNEAKYPLKDLRLAGYTFRLSGAYMAQIEEIQPDLVICPAHPGDIGHWRLALAKRKLGYKLVSWQCGYEYNPSWLKDQLVDRFVPKFDYHLAYHTNAKKYALNYGARKDQVTVIHNTINEKNFLICDRESARAAVLSSHPSVGDRKILLYVGAILKEKRLDELVASLDHLNRDDVVLVIVGDGPHLARLRSEFDMRDDVIFTGRVVEGVGVYFDAAEMYLLPGTGGLGINEAMAHGLPIISGYADGSADDLVVDGQTGYRLVEVTPQELACKVNAILNDPEKAERMGQTAREWSQGKYSFNSFVDRVITALVQLA